ncbi:hypothetical protein AJ80_04114 [Polytolypa hystricis UAMH7299]|uniref:Uncharacterized protein n=1 Tax=Polytolypa hystricis (strain UAMH7299) TaxID=1447883 RepID=A0A2B7YDU2_POLH7|nr:hypothetical protein AJ80_04114 [Polytolypa hystricis UAMH7299]
MIHPTLRSEQCPASQKSSKQGAITSGSVCPPINTPVNYAQTTSDQPSGSWTAIFSVQKLFGLCSRKIELDIKDDQDVNRDDFLRQEVTEFKLMVPPPIVDYIQDLAEETSKAKDFRKENIEGVTGEESIRRLFINRIMEEIDLSKLRPLSNQLDFMYQKGFLRGKCECKTTKKACFPLPNHVLQYLIP